MVVIFLTTSNLASGANLKLVIYYDVEIDSKNFLRGEPVIISLNASNPDAMNAYYHNLAYGNEEKQIFHKQLGSDKVPWINDLKFTVLDSKKNVVAVNVEAGPLEKNKVILDQESIASHRFFISAEDTIKLGADKYTIIASIKETVSNALAFTIIESKKDLSSKQKVNNFVKVGRYALLKGNFKKAKEKAKAALAIDEHSMAALNLLGDALTGLKEYSKALEVFDNWLKENFIQYPPIPGDGTYEGPELTIEKIANIKAKLKK